MGHRISAAGCLSFFLAVPCVAEDVVDDHSREVAERAALDALFQNEPMLAVGLSKGPASSSASAENYAEACRSWTMAPKDIAEFFMLGNAIPGEERHYQYSVYPCEYRGTLQLSDRVFEFQLNLASWAHLRDTVSGKDYLFGCREPCRHLFPPQAQWFDHHAE